MTDLRKRYNISDNESSASSSRTRSNDDFNRPAHEVPSPSNSAQSSSVDSVSVPESSSVAASKHHSDNVHSASANMTLTATDIVSKGVNNSIKNTSIAGNLSTSNGRMHRLVSSFTSHLELFPAPVLVTLSRPTPLGVGHSSTGSVKADVSKGVHHGPGNGDATTVPTTLHNQAAETLKAIIRWDPFVNSSEDGSCTTYKVTWKIAVTDKVAGE